MAMKGKAAHIRRLMQLRSGAARVANAVVYEGADMIRAEAHRLISTGSTSGKNHVPSEPGEPPNRDTGHLQAHIEASNPKPLVGRVTSSAGYAAALEFGTSKMAARPYMRVARDSKREAVQKNFVRKMNKIVKGTGL